jgi:hypothetical protein
MECKSGMRGSKRQQSEDWHAWCVHSYAFYL